MLLIDEEILRLGIEPKDGFGIFVLDLSAYFPYANQYSLKLEASLSVLPRGEGRLLDLRSMCVLNHRYPNRGYICMSGRYGRKICRNGCIVILPFNELNGYGYLNIGYGGGSESMVRISVPVSIGVHDKASCARVRVSLMLKDPNEPDLIVEVHERMPDGPGWRVHRHVANGSAHSDALFAFTQFTTNDTLETAKASRWIVLNEVVDLKPSHMVDMKTMTSKVQTE